MYRKVTTALHFGTHELLIIVFAIYYAVLIGDKKQTEYVLIFMGIMQKKRMGPKLQARKKSHIVLVKLM